MKFAFVLFILFISTLTFSQNKRGSIKVEKLPVDSSLIRGGEDGVRTWFCGFGGSKGGLIYVKSSYMSPIKTKVKYIPVEIGHNMELHFVNIKTGGVYFTNIEDKNSYLGYSITASSILPFQTELIVPFISFKHAFDLNNASKIYQTSLGVEYRFNKRLSINTEYGSLGNKISTGNSFIGIGATYLLF